MTNKKLRKAVTALLGTAALAGFGHQARATGATDISEAVGDPAGVALIGLGGYVWDGGNIDTTGNKSSGLPMGPPLYEADPKKSALLGWNHTVNWKLFEIKASGGYTIRFERSGGGANFQPAFTLFSTGAGPWDYRNTSSHSFNQVVGPDPDALARKQAYDEFARDYNNSPAYQQYVAELGEYRKAFQDWADGGKVGPQPVAPTPPPGQPEFKGRGAESYAADGSNTNDYMSNFVPAAGENVVEKIVGYANTGTWFINGDSNFVRGAQDPEPYNSTGDFNAHAAGNKPDQDAAGRAVDDWEAAHAGSIAPEYAGVGSAVNTSQGHAELRVWLPAGWYVLGPGGSCADLSCTPSCTDPKANGKEIACIVTPETAQKNATGDTLLSIVPNADVTAPLPIAEAGADQATWETRKVTLNGGGYDPKGSSIAAYQWRQVSGPPVTLSGAATVAPSFTAPWVGAGNQATLEFELVVTDSSTACGGKGCASQPATTVVTINDDPALLDCSLAAASPASLARANKKMVSVAIGGIAGPSPYGLKVTGVTSDEPVKDKAAKDRTGPDAKIKKGKATKKKPQAVDTVRLRAERQKSGNGRVYAVNFEASDGVQTCTGAVKVEVPTAPGTNAIDDGQNYVATNKK